MTAASPSESSAPALEVGDKDTFAAALWSAARAQNLRLAAAWEGVPLDGPIAGVRAVMTGHAIVNEARTTANVWHLDTGAGSPRGKLTIAQIDAYPLETTTLKCIRPRAEKAADTETGARR